MYLTTILNSRNLKKFIFKITKQKIKNKNLVPKVFNYY